MAADPQQQPQDTAVVLDGDGTMTTTNGGQKRGAVTHIQPPHPPLPPPPMGPPALPPAAAAGAMKMYMAPAPPPSDSPLEDPKSVAEMGKGVIITTDSDTTC